MATGFQGTTVYSSRSLHMNISQTLFLACQLESSSNMVKLEKKNKKKYSGSICFICYCWKFI